MDRCALFVDGGYVLSDGAMAVHGTRDRESVSWDHAGLIKLLSGLSRERTGLPVLRCYWYESTVEGRRAPEHVTLAELPGLKLRLGRKRPGRREGAAAEMQRDLGTLARGRAVSDAVIVSGDEDLAEVVAEVQDLGMRVVAVHITGDGNWTIPTPLRQECDDIVHVTGAQLRPFVTLITAPGQAGEHSRRRNGTHPAPGLEPQSLQLPSTEPLDNAAPGNAPGGIEPPGNEQWGSEQRRNEVPGFGTLNNAVPRHDRRGHEQPGIADGRGGDPGAETSPGLAGAAPPASGTGPGTLVPSPDAGAAAPGSRQTAPPPRPLAPELDQPRAQPEPQAPTAASGPERPVQRRSGPSHSRQSQPVVLPGDARFPDGAAAARFAVNPGQHDYPSGSGAGFGPLGPAATAYPPYQRSGTGQAAPQPGYAPPAHQSGRYSAQPPAAPSPSLQPVPQPAAVPLADLVQAAHAEGFRFGEAVARDAPALWLEAVLARKPSMPSDLESKLLQGAALPAGTLRYDEARNSLRRGFWDALERSRR